MAKKIQFDIQAREGLKRGVDALANASEDESIIKNNLEKYIKIYGEDIPVSLT